MRLVLSGGGTPGIIAHCAALDALRGIAPEVSIDRIGGVSAGAVAAALYAKHTGPCLLRAREFLCPEASHRPPIEHLSPSAYPIPWTYSGVGVRRTLARLLPGNMRDVHTHLSIVALNLSTRQQMVWDSNVHGGDLMYPRVYASMAMPGVFAPATVGDYMFVDGGATSNVPADDLYGTGDDILVLRITRADNPQTPDDPASFLAALVDSVIRHGAEEDEAAVPRSRIIELPAHGPTIDFDTPRATFDRVVRDAEEAVRRWVEAMRLRKNA